MTDTTSKYRVEKQQMDEYLKRRFVSVSITFTIIAVIVLSMLTFILYKENALDGLWSFTFSVPLIIGAFLFGIKLSHDKLRKLADTEFILTHEGIVQTTQNRLERAFKFSEIAVVNKTKFGTTIVKGNWLTKIDFYRPKKVSPYQLGSQSVIFIPSITTNYSELVERIIQLKRLT